MPIFCCRIKLLGQIALFCLWATLLSACSSSGGQEVFRTFEKQQWHSDSVVVFRFDVQETAQPHTLFAYVRNALEYPYYNLYLKYEVLDSQGAIVRASLEEIYLLHPQTGEPLGKGSGGIFTLEVPLARDVRFEAVGQYELRIRQYMRLETLPGLHALGAKLQKDPTK